MKNLWKEIKLKMKPIYGERVTLRPITRDDVTESYVAWLNDPEVNAFLESRFQSHSLQSVRTFIDQVIDDPCQFMCCILDRQTGSHVGNIKLGSLNSYYMRGDLGLVIGEKSAWGKGFGPEAIQSMTRFGFEALKLHRIYAGVYAENIGSTKAFLKAGFHVEGVLQHHWRVGENFQDGYILGALNPELGIKTRKWEELEKFCKA